MLSGIGKIMLAFIVVVDILCGQAIRQESFQQVVDIMKAHQQARGTSTVGSSGGEINTIRVQRTEDNWDSNIFLRDNVRSYIYFLGPVYNSFTS